MEFLNRKTDMLASGPLRAFLGIVMLSLALCAASCSDHVDSMVAMDLHASVYIKDDVPVSGAAIWLRDRSFSQRKQPAVLLKPVCVTDAHGQCKVSVRYRYRQAADPWLRYLEATPDLAHRFELAVTEENQRTVSRELQLSARQIQGAQSVVVQIRVPESSGRTETSTEERQRIQPFDR
jgi:hypothetical protein